MIIFTLLIKGLQQFRRLVHEADTRKKKKHYGKLWIERQFLIKISFWLFLEYDLNEKVAKFLLGE